MDDLLLLVQRRVEFALQLLAIAAQHANGERPKVVEEILVDELLVDAEVVRVGRFERLEFGRVEGNEVEAICGEGGGGRG